MEEPRVVAETFESSFKIPLSWRVRAWLRWQWSLWLLCKFDREKRAEIKLRARMIEIELQHALFFGTGMPVEDILDDEDYAVLRDQD